MPFYDITHAIPLSSSQQDALAEAITSIHLSKFPLTPALFVNIAFTDNSKQVAYIAGRRRRGNHIDGRVRLGDRKRAEFEDMRDRIDHAWKEIVVIPARDKLGAEEADKFELQRLVLYPSDPVGKEAGFEVPRAGEEKVWLEKYWDEFKQRAASGDKDFIDLVKTVEEKELL